MELKFSAYLCQWFLFPLISSLRSKMCSMNSTDFFL